MTDSHSITIAVMAGGESRRMGHDKASLPAAGATLLEHVAEEARRSGCPVLVVGRDRPTDWRIAGVQFVPDQYPGAGPLGGLATALRATDTDILAVACDMPFLAVAAFAWLLKQHESAGGSDGTVAENDGQIEPLFAIYRRHVLPKAEARLAENRRSLMGLINGGSFAIVRTPPEIGRALTNVNTPEEWASAMQVGATVAANELQTGSQLDETSNQR